MHKRTLNFVQRNDKLHILQVGTLGALLVCGVFAGVLIGGGGGSHTATIGDDYQPSSVIGLTETPRILASPRVIDGTPKSTPSPTRALSPEGRQVVYLQSSSDTPALYISLADGSSQRKLLNTRAENVALNWPRADFVSMSSQKANKAGKDLAVIDMAGNMTVLMSSKEFSYFTSDDGIMTWVRIIDTNTDIPLRIATSAHKCVWNAGNTEIICGVPIKNALTRDVPADHSATIDDIIRFDLSSGQTTTLYRGSSNNLISVINPTISSSGDLVFTNLFDQRLMSLEL